MDRPFREEKEKIEKKEKPTTGDGLQPSFEKWLSCTSLDTARIQPMTGIFRKRKCAERSQSCSARETETTCVGTCKWRGTTFQKSTGFFEAISRELALFPVDSCKLEVCLDFQLTRQPSRHRPG